MSEVRWRRDIPSRMWRKLLWGCGKEEEEVHLYERMDIKRGDSCFGAGPPDHISPLKDDFIPLAPRLDTKYAPVRLQLYTEI
jgi:hypothetical protein